MKIKKLYNFEMCLIRELYSHFSKNKL